MDDGDFVLDERQQQEAFARAEAAVEENLFKQPAALAVTRRLAADAKAREQAAHQHDDEEDTGAGAFLLDGDGEGEDGGDVSEGGDGGSPLLATTLSRESACRASWRMKSSHR